MSAQLPPNDLQSFHEFLSHQLENSGRDLSPEQSVEEFRAYQDEVQRFLAESQPSFDQAARGEAKPIDHDAVMERVRKRLAADGIAD